MIRNITAGGGFLFAALAQLGAEQTIIEIIDEMIRNFPEGREKSQLRIIAHQQVTILKYIRTLLFLPVFGMKRPIELDDYEGKTLGILASPINGNGVGRYRSTDRFLRELAKLKPGYLMSVRLAANYYNAFYSEESENGMRVFIDGHFKAIWTLKNIPRGKHGMMDKIMPGLEQVFLNGPRGHPLLHTTHPGDTSLKDHILSHIEEFERAIGKEVVNFVVIDNEGCSYDVFKMFETINECREQKIYLLTILRDNQYRFPDDFRVQVTFGGEITYHPFTEKDFHRFQRDRKGRLISQVALAEFNYQSNANRRGKKGEFMLRCAVVKKVRTDKISIIVTNAPWDVIPSGKKLAQGYYYRWPCQEAKFKEMAWLCNLNVNHGFSKKEVSNRMAKRKLEKALKTLVYDQRRLDNLGKELSTLEDRISADKGEGVRALRRREKREDLRKKRKGLLKKIEKDLKEVGKWEDKFATEPLYEIDTEMDYVMSNLKVLLENMFLYVHEKFFNAGPPYGIGLLLRTFIDHYGDLEIVKDKNDGLTYRFILNGFDNRKHRSVARMACERVNLMKNRTIEGIKIEMRVKRR